MTDKKAKREWLAIYISALAVFLSLLASIFAGLQWAEARQALRVSQRPWLRIDFKARPDNYLLVVTNVGFTAAQEVKYKIDCSFTMNIGNVRNRIESQAFPGDAHFLMPGETAPMHCFPAKSETERSLRSKFDGAQQLTLYAVVTYKDVFGSPHETHYCAFLRGNDPSDEFGCPVGNFAS
jgi:hypothetical protein